MQLRLRALACAPFRRLTFRTTTYFILSGLFPLLIIATYLLVQVRREAVTKVHDIQAERLHILRTITMAKFDDQELQLGNLAKELALSSWTGSRQRAQIAGFLATNSFFSSLYLFDAQGRLLVPLYKDGSLRDDPLVGKSYLDIDDANRKPTQDALREVMASKTPRRLKWTSSGSGRTYLQIVTPVFAPTGDGKLVGVLSALIVLNRLDWEAFLDHFPLRQGEYSIIADHSGRVFLHYGDKFTSDIATLPAYQLPGAKEDRASASGIYHLKGRKDYVTYTTLEGFDLVIIFGIPYQEMMGFLDHLLVTFAFLILGNCCTAVIFGILLAANLTRPINTLIRSINAVSAGAHSHPILLDRDDELGEACKAFNLMVDKLQRDKYFEELWLRKWSE